MITNMTKMASSFAGKSDRLRLETTMKRRRSSMMQTKRRNLDAKAVSEADFQRLSPKTLWSSKTTSTPSMTLMATKYSQVTQSTKERFRATLALTFKIGIIWPKRLQKTERHKIAVLLEELQTILTTPFKCQMTARW